MNEGPAVTVGSATFVLIHGGNNTGRYWERLVPLLDAPSLAVDLPGRRGKPGDLSTLTLDQVAHSIAGDVAAAGIDGPVILVAHSSGALGVPRVAQLLGDQVRRIVLSPGQVPPEGGCALDVMKPHHQVRLRQWIGHLEANDLPLTTPAGSGDTEQLRHSYGGRPLTDEELAFIADPTLLVGDSLNVYRDPVFWRPVRDIPLTFVRTLADRLQTLAMQDEFIERLPWADTVDIDSGHVPAVTDTAALAQIFNGVLVETLAA